MNLKDFQYELPEALIANHPLHRRDEAKLLVIDRKKKTLTHDVFSRVSQYLPKNSLVVLNNSKVIPARLLTKRENTGGEVELFLLKKLEDGHMYNVLMRPTKRLKVGEKLYFDNRKLVATIVDKEKGIVRFNRKNVTAYLERIGHIPLPPYIKREDTNEDKKYYQTVYAKKEGSVAAPTAGLHFTQHLLDKIAREGHTLEEVTLHVSYGTFKPVEEEDITQHKMHTEDFSVSVKTFNTLRKAKDSGKPIVAVGTTSCRVLETIAQTKARKGSTNIFIYPGYKFQMTDHLITNFHLPGSTLLMLVHAMGGTKLMNQAYQEAMKKKYRFYSYGDAMLIL